MLFENILHSTDVRIAMFFAIFSGRIRPSLAVPDRVISSSEELEPKQKGRLLGWHVYP